VTTAGRGHHAISADMLGCWIFGGRQRERTYMDILGVPNTCLGRLRAAASEQGIVRWSLSLLVNHSSLSPADVSGRSCSLCEFLDQLAPGAAFSVLLAQ
jgi:hypothetical protein